MEPERQRIQDDLRGLVDGEVRCDHVFAQLYAGDASIYEIKPLAVVRPRNTTDVIACVNYAREQELPIHPRGAGTGVAGGCLGRGIVLDFSHSMRRIIRTDDETVRVQPGVVLSRLNEHLRAFDRLFGPDPAGAEVTTMGSVAAVNRGGSHWLRYGSARDRIESLQVVLSDGSVLEVGRHAPGQTAESPIHVRRNQLVQQVTDLMGRHREAIDAAQPKSLVNGSGYQLHDVFENGELNVAKLLCGSEGTLAVITELTLRTDPLPKHRGVALLFFDRVEKAANAVGELSTFDLAACDLVDRRLLSLARESDVRFELLLPRDAEALLLIEIAGDDLSEVRSQLKKATQLICRRKRMAFDSSTVVDDHDVQLYWQLRHRVLPTLYRLTGNQRPLPFVEDIAVPPEQLSGYLISVQNILKRHEVTASLFAHAGHGQLHLRPFLDLANPAHVALMQRLATDLYQEALLLGGTISGEHGNGLSRSWYVRRQFPDLYNAFQELKRLFDPHGILNPGKVTKPEPLQLTKSLRPVTVPPRVDPTAKPKEPSTTPPRAGGTHNPQQPQADENTIQLLLNWSQEEIALATRSCNGCGQCRTQSEAMRMCPIFRFEPAEESSPRAKANLMRGLFTQQIHPNELATEQLKEIADLCVNCYQCRDECPAGVDIPKLMIECKAQFVATNGLPYADWILSRIDLFAPWICSFRSISNFVIGNRRLRWLLERLTGIAQGRKLPRVSARSFISAARRRRLTRPTRTGGLKILYFTDVYANWFDVELGESLVDVFQHNGIAVYVHPNQSQCGMSLISVGAVEKARVLASRNVKLLADAVRQGYHIVTSEPAAAMCLTREYPNMFQDDDVQLIAENTSEACGYLWKMHQRGQLELDLKPLHMSVGYHLPCHTRALGGGSPGENLLRLIPGLTVRALDKGCSGMAGTFGLKQENYRNSLRAGWPLISAIRDPILQVGATECSACKMQMEQGTSKPTIHPIKLLALAYGLRPEIADRLNPPGEELFIT